METLKNLYEQHKEIFLVIAGGMVAAVLQKLIPYLWHLLGKSIIELKRISGGRYAESSFEKLYLDWAVTELRELKLAGITSYDDAKKPQIEQVFVSLQIGQHQGAGRSKLIIEEFIRKYSDVPNLRELIRDLDINQTFYQLDQLKEYLLRPHTISGSIKWLMRKLHYTFVLEQPLQRRYVSQVDEAIVDCQETLKLFERAFSQGESIPSAELSTAINVYRKSHKILSPIIESLGFDDLNEPDQLQFILRRYQKIAILGAPGSGKTTLLQYIGLTYARERAGDRKLRDGKIVKKRLGAKKWLVPLFIPLGSIAKKLTERTGESDLPIVDLLPKLLPPDLQRDYQEPAIRYFKNRLEAGKCIVLLDGLDEVPTDAEFQAVVSAIKRLTLKYNENQFIITSRIAGWRGGVDAGFRTFYVEDLTDDQISTFINSWYSAVELNAVPGDLKNERRSELKARERKATQRALELETALRENIGIRHLATNPMLLSIIALVHRSLATLPKERIKLYNRCSEVLLEQWDILRGVRKDDTKLKLEQKEAIIHRVAHAIHTGEIGGKNAGREVSKKEVETLVAQMLPNFGRLPSEAPELLRRLIERSGLIIERRRNVLAFAHHTFQEYFTAISLSQDQSNKSFEFLLNPERLMSNWWREVILLYGGILGDTSDFLISIDNPILDDLCQQRLRLTALCLGEAVEVKKIDVRQSILVKLLRVRTRGEIAESVQAIPLEIADYLIKYSKKPEWHIDAAIANILLPSSDNIIAIKILAALNETDVTTLLPALEALRYAPPRIISEELRNKNIEMLTNSDSRIRSAAMKTLVSNGKNHFSEDMILSLMNNLKKESLREPSMNALMALNDKIIMTETISNNVDALSTHSDAQVRKAILEIFPISKSEPSGNAEEVFLNYFLDSSEAEATTLLEQSETKTPSAFDNPITALLKVGFLKAEHVLSHGLIEKLVRLFTTDKERTHNQIVQIFEELARHGLSSEIICELEPLLDQPYFGLRIRTIKAIGRIVRIGTVSNAVAQRILDRFIDELRSDDEDTREALASALIIADPPPDQVIRLLINLARDKSSKVRATAILELGGLQKTDLDPKIIDVIANALEDEEGAVRVAASFAVGSVNEKAASSELITKLLEAAEPERVSHRKRRDITYTIEKDNPYWMSKYQLPDISEIRQMSPTEIRRQTSSFTFTFQMAAIYALGIVGRTVEAPRIIKALCKVIERTSPKNYVVTPKLFAGLRQWLNYLWSKMVFNATGVEYRAIINAIAWRALGSIGESNSSPDLFKQLVSLIKEHKTESFYEGALNRLLQRTQDIAKHDLFVMGKQLSPDFILEQTASLLEDKETYMRMLGIDLLSTIKKEEGLDEIKSQLPRALSDNDTEIRNKALKIAEALIHENVVELIPKLYARLDDEVIELQDEAWRIIKNSNKTLSIWT